VPETILPNLSLSNSFCRGCCQVNEQLQNHAIIRVYKLPTNTLVIVTLLQWGYPAPVTPTAPETFRVSTSGKIFAAAWL